MGSADQEAGLLRSLLSGPNNIETHICFMLSAVSNAERMKSVLLEPYSPPGKSIPVYTTVKSADSPSCACVVLKILLCYF